MWVSGSNIRGYPIMSSSTIIRGPPISWKPIFKVSIHNVCALQYRLLHNVFHHSFKTYLIRTTYLLYAYIGHICIQARSQKCIPGGQGPTLF